MWGGNGGPAAPPVALTDICADGGAPLPTEVPELDRVLGGGLVPGSVTLLGGEPGIGQEHAEELLRDVVELGGSLTAEHGVGILRAPYLPLEQSSRLIALQRDLKRAFDPRGLLNPGKIFPTPGLV